jgi:CDP-diacylglycerol--serine O-phosphatidyltransferase
MRADVLIVRLNPAGCLTLAGLAVDMAAFLLLVDLPALAAGSSFTASRGFSWFFLAVGLMYLGMLADAFDGIVARKYKWESDFGRYLDGFVDVFNYLVIPNLALWRLGFRGPEAGVIISVMVAAGILRLSKFNMIGNIKVEGSSKYLGMPVFWSQLLFFPLYLLFAFAPGLPFFLVTAVVWLGMSFAFLYNRPFFKPKNPFIIGGIILALSSASFALAFAGIRP